MPVYGFSITKSVAHRGTQEEFSNVYHFEMAVAEAAADTFDFKPYVDEIVRLEKLVHGSAVTWLRARVWGPTELGPAASLIRKDYTLSGVGGVVSGIITYPELAVVISWPLSRSVATKRKRFLRKYLHVYRISDVTFPESPLITPTGQATFKNTYADPLDQLGTLVPNALLCAPNGDRPIQDPYVLGSMRIRQFRG